jgi:hypothetical protein
MFTSRYDQCSGVSPDFLYYAAPIVLSISLSTETPQPSTKANYQMKNLKRPLVAVAGLAALALVATSGGAGAAATAASLNASVFEKAVFAKTYVSTGATASTVDGDVMAGTYLTLGATSEVTGSSDSGGITTLGALAKVGTTSGTVGSVGFVQGAGATPGVANTPDSAAIAAGGGELTAAQSWLNNPVPAAPLPSPSIYPEGLGNIATDVIYQSGVYNVTGLRTYTANTTITIKPNAACDDFVHNATGYITFGAGVKVVMDNTLCTAGTARVFWNAGGYISIGAGAEILGTVIANTYVSLGATAKVSPADTTIGATCVSGVYSATSYVSLGAGAIVSGGGSCAPAATCEGDPFDVAREVTYTLAEATALGIDPAAAGTYTLTYTIDPCECDMTPSYSKS